MNTIVADAIQAIEIDLLANIEINTPIYGLIDQVVRLHIDDVFQGQIINISDQQLLTTVTNFSKQYGQLFDRWSYDTFKNNYLRNRFYIKGRLDGIATEVRGLINGYVNVTPGAPLDVPEVKSLLKKHMPGMKDWKANQIAQTEVLQAAHEAGLYAIEKSGLQFDAWFIVDPASCVLCVDLAMRNPMTVAEARAFGLPHIQCNDGYRYTLKADQKVIRQIP